ncbi:hypothetical protein LINPERHAP1_LOCUS15957 [Linum perenne]
MLVSKYRTSRPAHYYVLWGENKFIADGNCANPCFTCTRHYHPASPPINSLRLFPPPIHPLSGGFLFAFSSNPSSLRPPPSSIPPAASNSSIHLPPAASYPPIHLPLAASFSSSLVAEEQ